jgi:hypothetical protein
VSRQLTLPRVLVLGAAGGAGGYAAALDGSGVIGAMLFGAFLVALVEGVAAVLL